MVGLQPTEFTLTQKGRRQGPRGGLGNQSLRGFQRRVGSAPDAHCHGLWLWREGQAALWLGDPWGSAPEVQSPGAGGWNPPKSKERLPVGLSLDLCVCPGRSRTPIRASVGWASSPDGQLLLAWARHGGCTTASWSRTVCLDAIPPQSLEETPQVICPEPAGPQEMLLTACTALQRRGNSPSLVGRCFVWSQSFAAG